MPAFKSLLPYESIWRIRHTEETHRVFEVGSEQLRKLFFQEVSNVKI